MISFIIPAYNAEKTIKECIESILDQKVEKEVIVIDNNSTDKTYEIAEKYPVKLLSEEKKGPAAARNKGLDNAKGDYIACIDSDVVLPVRWAEKAQKKLEEDEKLAMVGGAGKSTDKSLVSKSLDGLLFGISENTEDRYANSIANMGVLYRGDAIKSRRFDENLLRGEEVDFNFSLVEEGHKILYSNELFVYHYHPLGLKELMKKWFLYGTDYPSPYAKHPSMKSLSYYARMTFFPVFLVLLILSFISPLFLLAAIGEVLLIFLAYTTIGIRNVKGLTLAAFPFVHTLKQMSQGAGITLGLFKRVLP